MPNWGPIARRAQSRPARCYRQVTEGHGYGRICGAELRLNLTVSPIPEYRELVTQTCLEGHVLRVQGVLERFPEVWAEGDAYGV